MAALIRDAAAENNIAGTDGNAKVLNYEDRLKMAALYSPRASIT